MSTYCYKIEVLMNWVGIWINFFSALAKKFILNHCEIVLLMPMFPGESSSVDRVWSSHIRYEENSIDSTSAQTPCMYIKITMKRTSFKWKPLAVEHPLWAQRKIRNVLKPLIMYPDCPFLVSTYKASLSSSKNCFLGL